MLCQSPREQEPCMTRRTVFMVSGGTGITAEAIGNSMLSQFGDIRFDQRTLTYVRNDDDCREAIRQIREAAERDGARPIVFSTLVNPGHRELLSQSGAMMLDLFGTFLAPLETELGVRSSQKVGHSHAVRDPSAYRVRIDAVHFALDNDDGAHTRHYDKADIILIGVSRSGKTPTSLYLALQFGLYTANYPLTEEDFDDLRLPESLQPHKDKLFALQIDPERLTAIRQERRAGSRYASIQQCETETRAFNAIVARYGIPFINVTERSIEEIATRILAQTGLKRRVK